MFKYAVIKAHGEEQRAFGPFTDLVSAKEFIRTDMNHTIQYFRNGLGDNASNFNEHHSFSDGSFLTFEIDTIGIERIDWNILKMENPNNILS